MAAETSLIVVFFSSPTGERCVVETTRESLKNAPAAPGGGAEAGRGVVQSGSVAQTLAASPLRTSVVEGGESPIPHQFESPGAQLPLHHEKSRKGSRS